MLSVGRTLCLDKLFASLYCMYDVCTLVHWEMVSLILHDSTTIISFQCMHIVKIDESVWKKHIRKSA